MFKIGKKEIYFGFVGYHKPRFIFHLHKGWWWIRVLGLQLEVMDEKLAPYMPWTRKP